VIIQVSESSQVGDARRKAGAYAEELRLGESRCSAIALATAEMATNLVKHAGKGHILVQSLQNGHGGLRLVSADKGPGIADIPKALSDGHSTTGSMGAGLGAIRRLADSFSLYSFSECGTVVCAEFWAESKRPNAAGSTSTIDIGVVSEPIAGEDVCGDGWTTRETADGVLLMVVDGLGHGIGAAEAAREAERIFSTVRESSTKEIIQSTHSALRATRGAAEGVARIDIEKGVLAYAGVGNISTSVVGPGSSRGLGSHNGILGQNMERVQEFTVPWSANSVLVMHSDGLATRWDLERYPGIWAKPACVIAAVLHRDFSRGRDDVTVLVAKAAA
jgi:anti-sigma regulatory factor (Ser/Thr protein kinase)